MKSQFKVKFLKNSFFVQHSHVSQSAFRAYYSLYFRHKRRPRFFPSRTFHTDNSYQLQFEKNCTQYTIKKTNFLFFTRTAFLNESEPGWVPLRSTAAANWQTKSVGTPFGMEDREFCWGFANLILSHFC